MDKAKYAWLNGTIYSLKR
uniref:Uncharacterized protein n=1 Tax=Arundo donax TaxID=35708 RepID=A0A0A9AS57_ARUDO